MVSKKNQSTSTRDTRTPTGKPKRRRASPKTSIPVTAESAALPVIEERIEVSKRKKETGVVRLSKHVHEREEIVDQPTFNEVVEIERVPVNRAIQEPAEIRYEGDTIIIPRMEEVLVIEKQLVLKEEIRITKRREEKRDPKHITLRSEAVDVERTKPDLEV